MVEGDPSVVARREGGELAGKVRPAPGENPDAERRAGVDTMVSFIGRNLLIFPIYHFYPDAPIRKYLSFSYKFCLNLFKFT